MEAKNLIILGPLILGNISRSFWFDEELVAPNFRANYPGHNMYIYLYIYYIYKCFNLSLLSLNYIIYIYILYIYIYIYIYLYLSFLCTYTYLYFINHIFIIQALSTIHHMKKMLEATDTSIDELLTSDKRYLVNYFFKRFGTH